MGGRFSRKRETHVSSTDQEQQQQQNLQPEDSGQRRIIQLDSHEDNRGKYYWLL